MRVNVCNVAESENWLQVSRLSSPCISLDGIFPHFFSCAFFLLFFLLQTLSTLLLYPGKIIEAKTLALYWQRFI